MVRLKYGDIVFVRRESWLGRAIRKLTTSRGEAPSKINHVGQIVTSAAWNHAVIVEALHRVKIHTMREAYPPGDPKTKVAVARPRNIPDKDLKMISLRAIKFAHRKYGYLKLVLHALDYAIGGRYFFRRIGRLDSFPICSYIVARTFGLQNRFFGVSPFAAQPDDIWDFVQANPDKYEIIFELQNV